MNISEKALSVQSGGQKRSFENPNRQACLDRLGAALFGEGGPGFGGAIKIYLENFKFFNDTFGYRYGGLLIAKIADFLTSLPGAEVYRPGGVDFVVLFEGRYAHEVEEVGRRIAGRFERTWSIDGVDCACSSSLAGIMFPTANDSAADLLDDLNQGIAQSQTLGRNVFVMFDEALSRGIYKKKLVAKSLRQALSGGTGLEVRYRPTRDFSKGRYARCESYLRLFCDELGIIPAAEVLPIAEESGLICSLDGYVIERAVKMIGWLLSNGADFESVTVPVSPAQFLQENFVPFIGELLNAHNAPAKKLSFEIDRTVLAPSLPRIISTMRELADMGAGFVLTGFGSSFMGIHDMLALPVSIVKLSRPFVWQLNHDPRAAAAIEGLINLAGRLGLDIIAEGVETQKQVDLLERFGCRYAQGFYYSPTVTADELSALFTKEG